MGGSDVAVLREYRLGKRIDSQADHSHFKHVAPI